MSYIIVNYMHFQLTKAQPQCWILVISKKVLMICTMTKTKFRCQQIYGLSFLVNTLVSSKGKSLVIQLMILIRKIFIAVTLNARSFRNVDRTRKMVKWYNEFLYLFIIIFHYNDCVDLTQMHPIQDCKRDPQCIKELGLEFSHKECIINGGWLTDEIINAGQKLLEKF